MSWRLRRHRLAGQLASVLAVSILVAVGALALGLALVWQAVAKVWAVLTAQPPAR